MRGCSGGHVWLLRGGGVVAPEGGHAWLLLRGGMCGCFWGGMHGCSRGACMVATGGEGHA